METSATNGSSLMRAVLDDAETESLREFASAYDVVYQANWSAVDLVSYARRIATFRGHAHRVESIDDQLAILWAEVADNLLGLPPASHSELCESLWVRGLAVLTVRFPSKPIHTAFANAMIKAGAMDRLVVAPGVQPAAVLFTPIWNRTIDRADPKTLRRVFSRCRTMFTPGDYFVGYLYAWRYGYDVAARYAQALLKIFWATNVLMPLGSADDMALLGQIVKASIPQDLHTADFFLGLDGPLSSWGSWLADELRDVPGIVEDYNRDIGNVTDELPDSLIEDPTQEPIHALP